MQKAVYIILLLCGILSQGICNVFEENNVAAENSSHLLIRQKRIVGGTIRRLSSNPYIVRVVKDGIHYCTANLLTNNVAISSAACFINQNTRSMRIESHARAGNKFHEIVRVVFLDPHYNPAHPTIKNLALVRFALPINWQTSYNEPIPIYSGNLATDHMMSRVVSWGRPHEVGGRIIAPENLQAFSVIVINIEYCQTRYPNIIVAGNICTFPASLNDHCENEDTGSPLIMNHQLLGIFVYQDHSNATNPIVFMNLLDHGIRRWIHEHVPSLPLF